MTSESLNCLLLLILLVGHTHTVVGRPLEVRYLSALKTVSIIEHLLFASDLNYKKRKSSFLLNRTFPKTQNVPFHHNIVILCCIGASPS